MFIVLVEKHHFCNLAGQTKIMQKQTIIWSFFFFVLSFTLSAQETGGFYFGVKGGLSIGFQRWNSFERDPLFRYHGIGFIETATEENVGLFAQLGYHIKGSAIRTPVIVVDSRSFSSFEIPFEFRNISLSIGAKQKFDLGIDKKFYYLLGVRGDYTVSTKLRPDGISEQHPFYFSYPFEDFVNEINYGLIAGGGIEIPLSEFVGVLFELTVNPDFSKQYNQPEIPNVINPNPRGSSSTVTIPERNIVNTTFEFTVGFKFLRKVEYID